ncbi:histidine phosphatase family protein [candidate division WWE3 bacterium]|uniref:Histidine phosphatase family protein n=1 Tax=candidate division WWE3 bacterium TaxID=2053526 RepID=A0A955LXB8_UNCKA|nr:histidine phosphatase family protein [candidate division WWE3 bacterium]
MKLCFVRHGTTGLVEQRQKAEDILSEEGEIQIRKLAQRVDLYKHSIATLTSSSLTRAYASAEIFAETLGLSGLHTANDALREFSLWVDPQDLHTEEIHAKSLGLLRAAQNEFMDFVGTLSHEKDDVHFLITHGNLIRAAIGSLIKTNLETIVRLSVSNASLSVVEYDGEKDYYKLILFNDTSHL